MGVLGDAVRKYIKDKVDDKATDIEDKADSLVTKIRLGGEDVGAEELEKASKMHAGQAKKIKSMLKYNKPGPFKMKTKSPMLKKGPCWEGYEMFGTKKKGGRTVPNCVPE